MQTRDEKIKKIYDYGRLFCLIGYLLLLMLYLRFIVCIILSSFTSINLGESKYYDLHLFIASITTIGGAIFLFISNLFYILTPPRMNKVEELIKNIFIKKWRKYKEPILSNWRLRQIWRIFGKKIVIYTDTGKIICYEIGGYELVYGIYKKIS